MKDLSFAERYLLITVAGYARKNGYCIASNATLAEKLQVGENYVKKLLTSLENKKHIAREYDDSENAKSKKRYIYLAPDLYISIPKEVEEKLRKLFPAAPQKGTDGTPEGIQLEPQECTDGTPGGIQMAPQGVVKCTPDHNNRTETINKKGEQPPLPAHWSPAISDKANALFQHLKESKGPVSAVQRQAIISAIDENLRSLGENRVLGVIRYTLENGYTRLYWDHQRSGGADAYQSTEAAQAASQADDLRWLIDFHRKHYSGQEGVTAHDG